MIIGLSGYARSGKDEAAKGLGTINFRRVAFADKLREFLYALNPMVAGTSSLPVRLKFVIDRYGWDGYKETTYGKDIRELLQRLGTECGREMIGDTVWVDAVMNNLRPTEHYVIADVRFPNEARAIKDAGGYVVRISRPGITAANAHKSETALDDWAFDKYVTNDGTLGDLQRRMYDVYRAFSQ